MHNVKADFIQSSCFVVVCRIIIFTILVGGDERELIGKPRSVVLGLVL